MRGGLLTSIAWTTAAGIPILAIGYGFGWDEGVIGVALLALLGIGVVIRQELVIRYNRRQGQGDRPSGAA